MTDRNDASLVAAYLEGDERAFNELYAKYYKGVVGHAYKVVKSEELAREIAQDVFVKVARFAHLWRSGRAFKPWLHKIVKHECINTMRRGSKHRKRLGVSLCVTGRRAPGEVEVADEQMDLLAELEWKEFWDLIAVIVEEFPRKDRRAFLMHHINGRTVEEIGELLRIPAPTAGGKIQRGRRILRERLGEQLREYWVA